jgi:hypothetical protein
VTALTVALVTFALVFGGALLGMYFRNTLSEDHLREDVRDVIKLSTGLIGTMAALVLGLLIASAKSSYDTKSIQIKQITADIIQIDLALERYGPDAQNVRIALREAIPPLIDRIWNEGNRVKFSPFAATAEAAEFIKKLQQLQPNNDSQRALQAQVLSAVGNLSQARLSLFTQSNDAIPTPFPCNPHFLACNYIYKLRIVCATQSDCDRDVFRWWAIGRQCNFLILEMGQPFTGLMQISSEAPRQALAPLSP